MEDRRLPHLFSPHFLAVSQSRVFTKHYREQYAVETFYLGCGAGAGFPCCADSASFWVFADCCGAPRSVRNIPNMAKGNADMEISLVNPGLNPSPHVHQVLMLHPSLNFKLTGL